MKRSLSFVVVVIWMFGSMSFATEEHKVHGDSLESYRDVQALSRGTESEGYIGTGILPFDTQCVDLTRDFATTVIGARFGSVTCAANMWDVLPDNPGYVAYLNGSTTKPQEGDLIIWWNTDWTDCDFGSGHVAIHTGEKNGRIRVFEQNWPEVVIEEEVSVKVDDTAFRWLTLSQTEGRWSINISGSSYFIKGWLRYPGYIPQDQFSNSVLPGQLSDSTTNTNIQACAQRYSGLNLIPHDNGGGLYVHDWYSTDGTGLVTIQDFIGQGGHNYAIIDNTRLDEAFLLHGGMRWYYMNILEGDGPSALGAPSNDQSHYTYYPYVDGNFDYTADQITWFKQEFELSDPVLWSKQIVDGEYKDVYAKLLPTGGADFSISLDNGIPFTIALTSSFVAYPLSSTQVYVSSSPVAGGSSYEVYRDGSYVGELDLSLYEFTDTELTPNTSYVYQLKIFGDDGSLVQEYDLITVVTPSVSSPDVTIVNLNYTLQTNRIEVAVPTLTNATVAKVLISDSIIDASPNTFVLSDWLENGSYSLQVKLFDADGNLIGQSIAQTVEIGARVVVQVIESPPPLRPNQTGEVVFRITNNYQTGIRFPGDRLARTSSSFVITEETFTSPGDIPSRGSREIIVPFTTGPSMMNISEVMLAIQAQGFDGDGNRISFAGQHYFVIEPMIDLSVNIDDEIGIFFSEEISYIMINVTNEGESTCPPSRLELYLDGNFDDLIASILTPSLTPEQVWTMSLPIGIVAPGEHIITAWVDPYDQFEELQESGYTTTEERIVEENLVITFNPAQDTFMSKGHALYPFGSSVQDQSSEIISVSTRAGDNRINRGLIQYNFDSVPQGFRANRATQRLYALLHSEYAANGFWINRILDPWDENHVTWTCKSQGANWGAWGGLFSENHQVGITIPAKTGRFGPYDEWFEWDITNIFNTWMNGEPNNGIIIRQTDYDSRQNQAINFASIDHSDESLHPQLVLEGDVYADVEIENIGNNIDFMMFEAILPPPPESDPELVYDIDVTDPIITLKANSIAYEITVTNTGDILMNNVAVRAYLSQDDILLNGNDVPMGRMSLPKHGEDLLPGQSATFSAGYGTWGIDRNDYPYFLVKVDFDNDYDEVNEDNNLGVTRH